MQDKQYVFGNMQWGWRLTLRDGVSAGNSGALIRMLGRSHYWAPELVLANHVSLTLCDLWLFPFSLLQIWWLIIGGPALTEPFKHSAAFLCSGGVAQEIEKAYVLSSQRSRFILRLQTCQPCGSTEIIWENQSVCLQVTNHMGCVSHSIYGKVGVAIRIYCIWKCDYGLTWECCCVFNVIYVNNVKMGML